MQYLFEDSIDTIVEEPDGVAVTFEHAPPDRFDLIGADGLDRPPLGLRDRRSGSRAGLLWSATPATLQARPSAAAAAASP